MNDDEVDGTEFLNAIFDKAFEAGQDEVFVRQVQIEGEAYYKRYRARVIGLASTSIADSTDVSNPPSEAIGKQ